MYRYKLLLEDLLKHTKESHIDYSKINSKSTIEVPILLNGKHGQT